MISGFFFVFFGVSFFSQSKREIKINVVSYCITSIM